ncbi:MAG TPA: hypothetical protein VF519_06180 [Mycobacteriales bacterium]|jgi:hypothetical protein
METDPPRRDVPPEPEDAAPPETGREAPEDAPGASPMPPIGDDPEFDAAEVADLPFKLG